eukprot:3798146-Alexandrium_andersonii.AAC.1
MVARAAATSVTTMVTWGAVVERLPVGAARTLASSILTAVWGEERRMRCMQVAFAVIFPGRRLHPAWAEAVVALTDFRRI